MSRVHLHIDRLVLPALEPAEQKAVVAGLRAELIRLLSDHAGVPRVRPHRTPVWRLAPMPIEPGQAGGRKFGGALGNAIGRRLRP